jgi:hypothetical protein
MKKLSVVVALFALALPAVTSAQGGNGHKSPAKRCKAMRATMGAEAFQVAFSKDGKRALKRCAAAQRKARQARRRARRSCRAAGKRGPALKRCIRSKLAVQSPAAAPEAFKEALEVCKQAREEDPEGFAEEYGEGMEAIEACIAVQTDEPDEEGSEDEGTGEDVPGDEVEDDPVSEPDPA